MPYLSSAARMRKIPTRLPYSWLPQPPMSGNCGWLPLHSPSGPPSGLTASGVSVGTSQSQMLEVDDDGKGDAGVVRPSQNGARNNRGPGVKVLVHAIGSFCGHRSTPAAFYRVTECRL